MLSAKSSTEDRQAGGVAICGAEPAQRPIDGWDIDWETGEQAHVKRGFNAAPQGLAEENRDGTHARRSIGARIATVLALAAVLSVLAGVVLTPASEPKPTASHMLASPMTPPTGARLDASDIQRRPDRKAASATINPDAGHRNGAQIWTGNFDTGDLSQWDNTFNGHGIKVVTADAGIVPREGSHFGRFEVRNEPAPWSSGVNVAMAYRYNNIAGHYDVLGDDRYYAFSMYLPAGFAYVPNQQFNIFWEQHGDNTFEASALVLLDSIIRRNNPVPSIAFQLNAGPGMSPSRKKTVWRLSDVLYNQWVDFVIHIKWAKGTGGVVEIWVNGVKKVAATGISTWYDSGQSTVKTQVGYYRLRESRPAVLYMDAVKTVPAEVVDQLVRRLRLSFVLR